MTDLEYQNLEVDSPYRGFFEKGWLNNKRVQFYKSGDGLVTLTTGEKVQASEIKLSVRKGVHKEPCFHKPNSSHIPSRVEVRPKHQSEFRSFDHVIVKEAKQKAEKAKQDRLGYKVKALVKLKKIRALKGLVNETK